VFTSAADKEAKVTVESQGPQEVVLKAEGQLVGARGKKGFNYVVRIHAYAGSERLRVVPTVMMLYGKRNDTAKVKDLGFEIAVAGGASQFAIGGEKSIAAGGLSAGKDATIFYDSSDHYALGGAATGSGKGKSTKPLTVGWADLSGGGVGVAAGCRYFWQTFPKAISVGDGKLVLHLVWAPAAPLEIFSGMARTHELLVVPHAGATAAELQPRRSGTPTPARSAPSPPSARRARTPRRWPRGTR
jgi:hypothetical protein